MSPNTIARLSSCLIMNITDGRGLISGNFTVETANDLAVQLRYGSLPIPLKVVEGSVPWVRHWVLTL